MNLFKFFKDNNFTFWLFDDDRNFFCVGKRGRCYKGKFSVYKVKLMKEGCQYTETITYERVEKSFSRRRDAVDYILDILLVHYKSRP
jgi:hypothetical protein